MTGLVSATSPKEFGFSNRAETHAFENSNDQRVVVYFHDTVISAVPLMIEDVS